MLSVRKRSAKRPFRTCGHPNRKSARDCRLDSSSSACAAVSRRYSTAEWRASSPGPLPLRVGWQCWGARAAAAAAGQPAHASWPAQGTCWTATDTWPY
eukprot:5176449-Prymnesium_polylepis.1